MQSLVSQTYGEIEYLLVDGGSTDRTLEIARSFGDFVRIYERPGASQARAVNEGFALSHGEYFGFLNADDTLEKHAIAAAVDALVGHSEVAYVYGKAMHVDAGSRPIAPYPTRPFSLEALQAQCIICQPATLLRSSAFAAVGGIDESWDSVLDYDLWIRLTRADLFPMQIDEFLAHSRMHGDSKTLRGRLRMFEEICLLMRRHYDYVPFSWIHAYAGYLIDQKDQFFELPSGSPQRSLKTLTLGLHENKHRVWRFLKEFTRETWRLWATKRHS